MWLRFQELTYLAPASGTGDLLQDAADVFGQHVGALRVYFHGLAARWSSLRHCKGRREWAEWSEGENQNRFLPFGLLWPEQGFVIDEITSSLSLQLCPELGFSALAAPDLCGKGYARSSTDRHSLLLPPCLGWRCWALPRFG